MTAEKSIDEDFQGIDSFEQTSFCVPALYIKSKKRRFNSALQLLEGKYKEKATVDPFNNIECQPNRIHQLN